MFIEKSIFGRHPDGREVDLYTLANGRGMKTGIMTYGATVVFLEVPDRHGNSADITLGHDSLEGYLEASPYFGAIVGRYANRIAEGRFTLDDKEYELAANDGKNHLHGGLRGFDKVIWEAEAAEKENAVGVTFRYSSPHGEEGYPGNLDCSVTYWLTEDGELKLEYHAVTDKATPVNLTHHSYFNLAGQGNGDILGHELMLNADKYTPVNDQLIPTGEIKPVKGTPFDFTSPHTIGERIHQVPGGYDHNFVLKSNGEKPAPAARVYEPESGRVMEIHTTEPGIQFYSGNFLDGTITGKSGKVYHQHYGFCLETQHFPDSPNHPHFPPTILRPGEAHTSTTVYKFGVKETS
ncbi:MAG: aldose epimerase family protein [Candidatus Aminicenantes bacterium]